MNKCYSKRSQNMSFKLHYLVSDNYIPIIILMCFYDIKLLNKGGFTHTKTLKRFLSNQHHNKCKFHFVYILPS